MKGARLSTSVALALGVMVGFGGLAACSSVAVDNQAEALNDSHGDHEPGVEVISTEDREDFARSMSTIQDKRVIYVGETHDRFGHHLNQLAVIEELHRRNFNLAIGMEFFQRPFQRYLDDYVAGRISEKEMLRGTEFYRRWRYDYRLYRPILEFARDKGIPLIALNAPSELVKEVSRSGWLGVSRDSRAELPEVSLEPDADYQQRLRRVFSMHPKGGSNMFERFLQVQLLWDEYMAESVADYLVRHPQRKLIVLAGSGHVRFGSGIPDRVSARTGTQHAVVLSGRSEDYSTYAADVILSDNEIALPRAGRLGLYVDDTGGGVTVNQIDNGLTTTEIAISTGDRILSIAGEKIRSFEDVRLAMLDRLPGEQVWIELERGRVDGTIVRMKTYLELI